MAYSWGEGDSKTWEGGSFSYGDKKKSYESENLNEAGVDAAYTAAAKAIKGMLDQNDLEILSGITEDDIVIFPGCYDQVESILKDAGIPCSMANAKRKLNPDQVVLVNCPGSSCLDARYKQVKDKEALVLFVEDGGFLVTTDWALDNVIPSFSSDISHGGKNTEHDVVEIDLMAEGSPYTRGLGGGSLKPLWWLESSSYPVHIAKKKEVDVLLASKELEQKYGESPVAVKFAHGKGRVIHVVSHFYLKYIKNKYEAQDNKTGADFVRLFLALPDRMIGQIKELQEVSFGALEAAYTSVRFLFNVFLVKFGKKRDAGQKTRPLNLDS